MEKRKHHIVGALIKYRISILILVCLVTIASVPFAQRVRFENSLETWFVENDPALEAYRAFLDRFEADELIIIGAFLEDDVFTPDNLAVIDRMTKAVGDAPYVHKVHSLSSIRSLSTHHGGFAYEPLMARPPKTMGEARAIRDKALSNPLLQGVLVSEDRRATAIIIELSKEGSNFAEKIELVSGLREITHREQRPGITFRLAGTAPLDAAFLSYSSRDLRVILPFTVMLTLLATYAVFRRLSAALMPLAVVGLACLWISGLMGALGIDITVMSSALFAFILAVGVADSIHIVSEYYHQLTGGRSVSEAVRRSLERLIVPCLFTSFTTAAGLLSLLSSDLKPIREFALLSASGTLFAFFFSITIIPALLPLSRGAGGAFPRREQSAIVSRTLEVLGRPSHSWSLKVMVLSCCLLLLAIWPLSSIEVGPDVMNYFPEDAAIRADHLEVEKVLGGSGAFEIIVDAPKEGFKDPETLRHVDTLQDWLERLPGITHTFSVVDSLKMLHQLFSWNDPTSPGIPPTRETAEEYYSLLELDEGLESMLQSSHTLGRVTVRVKLSDSTDLIRRMGEVYAYLDALTIQSGLQFEVTGFIALMNNMELYLLRSQIRSILIAFGVVTLLLIALLRSVKLGLFSMIPNFIPIVLGLALMGLAGIPLDPGTVMIGSIALGLVVDDSVHFLTRLRRQLTGGQVLEKAIERAMTQTGRPIMLTSLILSAGFGLMVFGSFSPNIHFGLVAAIVILIALVADLVLLPAALLVLRPTGQMHLARHPDGIGLGEP